MKLSKIRLAIGCFVFFSFLFFGPATSYSDGMIEIEIDVAPNVLNIQSEGTVVTVHTDIPYSLVEPSSVTLNEIEISGWKTDNRGNFVAKFPMDEVKLLDFLIGQHNDFGLNGVTIYGVDFEGKQAIFVIDVLPQGE